MIDPDDRPPPEPRRWFAEVPALPGQATRGQRVALVLGLLVVAWLALQLFASILAPFVAAAGIAYVLDPPTTRLTRLGLGRGLAALLMILALLAGVLLFALLLYPLILQQIGLLLGRIPQYVQLLQRWASEVLTDLQQNFGSDVVNDKLRDLVSSQAGNMLSFIASSLTSVTGAGFAIFNVLTLAVVTPVVGFYLLRDWQRVIAMVDSWLPHRYADVIRAQAREVDRILSAWVRGQALCCLILALYYASALSVAGLDLGLIVGIAAGLLSFIPYVGSITGGITALGLAMAQFPTVARRDRGGRRAGGGPDPGRLRDLSAVPGRPGGTAGGVGDLRPVRRCRGVRLRRRDAGGAGGRHHRRAVPLLAASLS